MTDAAYTFNQTVSERKSAGTGTHHKVVHKYTGVKLPSDYLTAKERNALNGEMVSVNMNRPIKFSEFKKLSADMKKEYMESLIRRFSVPKNRISQMMGVSYWSLYTLLKEANIEIKPAPFGTKWDEAGWNAWVNGENVRSEGFVSYTHDKEPETKKVSVKKTVTKTPAKKTAVQAKTQETEVKTEKMKPAEQVPVSMSDVSITATAEDIRVSSEQMKNLTDNVQETKPKADDSVVVIEKQADYQMDYANLFNALLQSGKQAHVTITFDI